MSVPDVFRRIVTALEQAGIAYMLTGSFASAHYGALRSTQDIDFVIEASPAQLRAFTDALPTNHYYVEPDAALEAHKRQSMFNVIDQAAGWKVDFIIRKSRPYSHEEFRRRQQAKLHGVSLFITTAEDAIISKLEWAKLGQSQRQIEDAAAILRVRWDVLDKTYVGKWIDQLDLMQQWRTAKNAASILD